MPFNSFHNYSITYVLHDLARMCHHNGQYVKICFKWTILNKTLTGDCEVKGVRQDDILLGKTEAYGILGNIWKKRHLWSRHLTATIPSPNYYFQT